MGTDMEINAPLAARETLRVLYGRPTYAPDELIHPQQQQIRLRQQVGCLSDL